MHEGFTAFQFHVCSIRACKTLAGDYSTILREAAYLDFAKQLQWPSQKCLDLSASKERWYLSNLLPQHLLGMRCIMKGLTLDHMGATRKRKNINFGYRV